jgi:hypothetical protein
MTRQGFSSEFAGLFYPTLFRGSCIHFHEPKDEEAISRTQSMSCWHRVLRIVTPLFVGSFPRFRFKNYLGQSAIRTKLLPNQNLAEDGQVAGLINGNRSPNDRPRN